MAVHWKHNPFDLETSFWEELLEVLSEMLSSTTAQWCLMRLDCNYNLAMILIGSSCYSSESWDTQTLKQFFTEATYEHISQSWSWSCSLAMSNWGYSMKLSSFWSFMAINLFIILWFNVCLIRRIIRETMGWLLKSFWSYWSFLGHALGSAFSCALSECISGLSSSVNLNGKSNFVQKWRHNWTTHTHY